MLASNRRRTPETSILLSTDPAVSCKTTTLKSPERVNGIGLQMRENEGGAYSWCAHAQVAVKRSAHGAHRSSGTRWSRWAHAEMVDAARLLITPDTRGTLGGASWHSLLVCFGIGTRLSPALLSAAVGAFGRLAVALFPEDAPVTAILRELNDGTATPLNGASPPPARLVH